MGSVISYFNYVYLETPKGKSVTFMKDKQDGPHDNDGPSSMSVVGHLEKVWRPLGDGSLTIMTVVQDGPSRV